MWSQSLLLQLWWVWLVSNVITGQVSDIRCQDTRWRHRLSETCLNTGIDTIHSVVNCLFVYSVLALVGPKRMAVALNLTFCMVGIASLLSIHHSSLSTLRHISYGVIMWRKSDRSTASRGLYRNVCSLSDWLRWHSTSTTDTETRSSERNRRQFAQKWPSMKTPLSRGVQHCWRCCPTRSFQDLSL